MNLAVADTLKSIKHASDTYDHCLEICKLIKTSPRRAAIFSKLNEEMAPVGPGLRKLCPTRWSVLATSLQSIMQNYALLNATWHEASDVVKQFEMKARINGVAAKMKELYFLFGLMLAEKLLKHSDNFS